MKCSTFVVFIFFIAYSMCEEFCPYLLCGKNALKTVNPEDFSDCFCSCPHDSQGDPLFECKVRQFGIVPSNSRFLVTRAIDHVPTWPWMCTLGYFDTTAAWVHQCGGSLITARHVLTAAHCTTNIDVKKYYVLVGVNNLTKDSNENWTERRVEKIYLHPKFEELKGSSYYDVAVIVLDKAVPFSEEILPVRIPGSSITNPDHYSGSSVSIMGWGDGSKTSLDSDEIQIYKQRNCNEKYEREKFGIMRAKIGTMLPLNFTRGVFCAGNPNDVQGACHGDSGGPLVRFEQDLVLEKETPYFVQIGIIQGGAKCGDSNLPGVFVSLTDETVLEFVLEKSGLKRNSFWGPWTPFTPCSVSCGDGIQTRKRKCLGSSTQITSSFGASFATNPSNSSNTRASVQVDTEACEGPSFESKKCNWGECGDEIFSLSYIAVSITNEFLSGCDCKIFIQLTNPQTGEKCVSRRLNKPGNDWAQGTTDVWDNEFLGTCSEFSVSSKNQELEIDFLLSGRDHIQVEAVTASFKSRTSIKEIKFQQFCLGWSGHDLRRTDRMAEKPSLLFAKLYKQLKGFAVSSEKMNRHDAHEFCTEKNSHLAEIHAQCQELKIQEYLKSVDLLGNNTFWIGLTYAKNQSKFTWNGSRQTISHSNWDNDVWPTGADRCVRIKDQGKMRKWEGLSCSYFANALCQAN